MTGKPKWVYGVGRCASCRVLHVVRTRHPEAPIAEQPRPRGAVPIGQHRD